MNARLKERVFLHGGGGHAKVVLDCLRSQGAEVLGVFASGHTQDLFGVPHLGEYDPQFSPDAAALIAIGDNAVRKNIATLTAHRFTNAIHPSAIISGHARIGIGNMILHGAIIQAHATLSNHVIVNTGAQVDHDCVIDDYVHVAPGAVLCGGVTVGAGALIGAGATIIPRKKIGAWAIVGAGAVVVEDIPDFAVAVGNPAKVIRIQTI